MSEKKQYKICTMPCGNTEKCWLDCESENLIARAMYESAGFRDNGEMCDGSAVMEVNLFR